MLPLKSSNGKEVLHRPTHHNVNRQEQEKKKELDYLSLIGFQIIMFFSHFHPRDITIIKAYEILARGKCVFLQSLIN